MCSPWHSRTTSAYPSWLPTMALLRKRWPRSYRQAGFCRMALGSPKGRQDYRQAISSYESLASRKPELIFLRTGLIETLYEYSRMLTAPADQAEAEASFRRALAVAESLIGNPEADKHCYTMGLVGPLNDLAWAARQTRSRSALRRPAGRSLVTSNRRLGAHPVRLLEYARSCLLSSRRLVVLCLGIAEVNGSERRRRRGRLVLHGCHRSASRKDSTSAPAV